MINLLTRYGIKPLFNLKEARRRTEKLISQKFGLADAAHIAFAEQAADVFISCDDKLLACCKKTKIKIKAFNPIEFCLEEKLR